MNKTTKAAMVPIDAHTHILPEMDDGSQSVGESVRLLRMLRDQGVSAICTTPHFYPWKEAPEAFLTRREKSIRRLLAKIKDAEELPQIYFGAEVEFFPGISQADGVESLMIAPSRILLVEMPFARWTKRMLEELYALKEYRDITPLLAHVDRYLDFGNEDMVEELAQRGILIQANQSFFLRGFASRRAMRMLKRGLIHFIGSDCHNLNTRRPELDRAYACIRKKCGEEAIEYLFEMQKLIRERGDAD